MKNIRFVLVEPSHPGNIGAVARAMKTMGFSQLYLVNPEKFPHAQAKILASRADDILEKAIVTHTLEEALKTCTLVIGASARVREHPNPLLTARQTVEKIFSDPNHQNIAILFGRESSGLTNAELRRCQYQLNIPTVSNYRSLNLAAAVQIVAYELRMQSLEITNQEKTEEPTRDLATADDLEGLFKHIEETLIKIDFLDPNNPRRMMPRIRQIIHRAQIDKDDLNLLRGMMHTMQYTVASLKKEM